MVLVGLRIMATCKGGAKWLVHQLSNMAVGLHAGVIAGVLPLE